MAIVGRAITLEYLTFSLMLPIRTDIKNQAKKIKCEHFTVSNREKCNIAIATLKKNNNWIAL